MAHEHKDGNTKTAFFLNFSFTIIEIIGGIISGSVAILADALHDFADTVSLGFGWYFEKKSEKGSNDKYSYGYARFSLLGAMINAIMLLLGSIFVIYKSITRIINPQMPDVYWMLGISILGVLLNGLAVWKLKSGKSMNKQVMTIHLLEDALGWVAVLIGSIVLMFYNIPIIDPILAIVINITVLIFVMSKLVKSMKIMLQRVPSNVNLPELRQKLLCLDNVKKVEHLHVWSLNKEKTVVSAHLITDGITDLKESEQLKEKVRNIVSDLKTEHITIDIKNEK